MNNSDFPAVHGQHVGAALKQGVAADKRPGASALIAKPPCGPVKDCVPASLARVFIGVRLR